MTEKLHPTPTRLALLAAVKAKEVTHHAPLLPDEPYEYDSWRTEGRFVRVTSRMDDMRRAGWVDRPPAARYHDSTVWHLTDEGERILREYGGGS
jgi:hypothetical protein